MRSKPLLLILISIIIFFSACKKEEDEVLAPNQQTQDKDPLEEYGILNEWKLEARSVDGVSDLSIQCCDSIILKSDQIIDDFQGSFTARGLGYEKEGTFEVDTLEKLIYFEYDTILKTYNFRLSDKRITFSYNENDQFIEEWWVES